MAKSEGENERFVQPSAWSPAKRRLADALTLYTQTRDLLPRAEIQSARPRGLRNVALEQCRLVSRFASGYLASLRVGFGAKHGAMRIELLSLGILWTRLCWQSLLRLFRETHGVPEYYLERNRQLVQSVIGHDRSREDVGPVRQHNRPRSLVNYSSAMSAVVST